jgi:hypothetical protein
VQQSPVFERPQRLIKAVGDHGRAAGRAKIGMKLDLRGSRPATIGFQLKREPAALVQQDQVSYAGTGTKAAKNCCLDRSALAAVGDMKPNEAGRTALTKMLADSTLN